MISEEDIKGQFQLFNVEPNSDVILKCIELCTTYNIDAEELIEQWFAFTTSVLKGAAPSVEYLERMERKELLKNKDQGVKKISTSLRDSNMEVANEPTTPVSKKKITGMNESTKLGENSLNSIGTPGTPSVNYSKRLDKRSVRCSYGTNDFKQDCIIKNLLVKPVYEENIQSSNRFMYEILRKRGRCINNMTEDLIEAIKNKYGLNNFTNTEINIQNTEIFFGRIVSDSDGKINNQSVLLELTQRNKGQTLNLVLSKMLKYSLFPGQTVGVKGRYEKTNGNTRDKILVEEIYSDTNFNMGPEIPITNGSIQLVIASGPFTTPDNLLFEPLQDLLEYVRECKPNALLLLGPFYDPLHPGITNGELKQTFDTFFFDIVENIMKSLEYLDIHVVIVSSHKEPHHFPIFPTPPYSIRGKYENLSFLPDPALVNINGLILGLTTADILFDISNYELHLDKTNVGLSDRMGRLASHLLKQQSFYPLDPPGKDMLVDISQMEANGTMGVKPHILVLPSNLRHFIKQIDDCLVINPERLTKGTSGGTFARIQVDGGSTMTVCNRSTCQILRI